MANLDFERQIFLELVNDDGLTVLAKGMGMEKLAINLINTYSDAGNLIFVIGSNTVEEEYILNKLKDAGVSLLPKIITAEVSTKDRGEVYAQGGVLFVSSRILVVDMLVNRVPFNAITGIVVFRAHKILESCQEAFILRLYRMQNSKGFVKALSSNPSAFTRGFSQVQRIMRNLFVKNLFLWPRFHAVVASSLEKTKPEVIEIHVPMTNSMTSIQIAILDLMTVCVKELKHINPSLDTDELTVENAVAKSFDKIIKYQLEPIWHQLNSKTRRLISDLKLLRSILQHLTEKDCVTFYSILKSIRDNVNVSAQISDWLFLDASDALFLHSKERVFSSSKKKESTKGSKILKFEENTKWKALSDVLHEITEECDGSEKQIVLIVVNDDSIIKQLEIVLSSSGEEYLKNHFFKLFPDQASEVKLHQKSSKRKLKEDEQTLTQMVTASTSEESETIDTDQTDSCLSRKYPNLIIQFYPIKNSTNNHFLFQTLCEHLLLKYVIFYNCDLELIRRIEVHQAINSEKIMKVYFLVYDASTEESSYLTSLRREKESFEFLIKEKAQLVLPEDIDGKTGDHPDLVRGSSLASETVNSRKAGGQQRKLEDQKIIVDMREFRSELPSLIHRRGIEIVPVTLEIGDYVLTPDMVVERKSVSDLIGSLNSGRLYTQAQSMCRLYKKPILLIEFDQNKAFSLQGKYYFNTNVQQNVVSKLILLTTHFPELRILWCSSPYATAEMFELLKLKKEQPDKDKAALLKAEGKEGELSASKFNTVSYDFISKLPGLNSKNMWPVLRNINSIADLVNHSEEAFNRMLNNSSAAKSLWKSINGEIFMDVPTAVSSFKKTKKPWKSGKSKEGTTK